MSSDKELNVLLVEDNLLNQKVVKIALEQNNFKVDIANNGFEGIDLFKENKYNFILMDIMMPKMDGFEVTEKIRELEAINSGESTPIIALTADVSSQTKKKCVSCGMDHYMTKPFNYGKLMAILKELSIVDG